MLVTKNSSRGFIAAKLLTALLAATLLLPSSTNAATAYPNCPLTGKPPTKPTVPPTRCVGASNLSCCPDACADLNFAVQALGVNVTAAVWPKVADIDHVSFVAASIGTFMKGNEICAHIVEQLACAVQCNPGQLTEAFLEDMLQLLLVPIVAQHIPGFNATFADTACYGGPTLIPVLPLSCDPLTIPATCPPGAVNMTAAKNVSGRPLDPAICAGFPYSNATRPFPDANGDVNAPYPYTPTPTPPAPAPGPSAPAPALSPPTPSPPAPITGAPPPSVVSPSPPSVSSAPAGPIPSPPPAGPIPSPPPKAAGPSGTSLAVAVLPLLMVVLMAEV
ncbi:unnamed protein product [Closterium sp. Naga37s-1]|nr:unnamed protein product [Closterium sp. Naga37s-1]